MFSYKRKEVTFVTQISYLKIVRSVWILENSDFKQKSH